MIQDVTSPQNNLVKLAKSLDRKKARTESGLFLAEGARHVGEGLDLGWELEALLFSAAAEARPAVQSLAQQALKTGARVARVSDRVLEAVAKRASSCMSESLGVPIMAKILFNCSSEARSSEH